MKKTEVFWLHKSPARLAAEAKAVEKKASRQKPKSEKPTQQSTKAAAKEQKRDIRTSRRMLWQRGVDNEHLTKRRSRPPSVS